MYAALWFAIGLSALLLLQGLFYVRRRSSIRALASRLGFSYLGDAFPTVEVLRCAPFDGITSTWNFIEGRREGIRVVSFDCRIGVGKGSWRRTVIAAETSGDVFGVDTFNPELTVDQAGSWVVLYQPKSFSFIPPGLIPIKDLEAHIISIRHSE